MLTAEQITCFNTFGCLVFRQIFSPEEIEAITRAAEEVWEKELGRQPGEEEPITTDPFVEKHPRLTQLVEDDRIYQPMAQLLGKDFIWSSSEGNRGFSPGQDAHHWHADRHGIEELNYTRIKIMLYLDALQKEEGCLRVIPGSHRSPLHEDLDPFQRRHVESNPTFFGMNGADVPCYAVETEPGDIVVFNQSLYHAVYGKRGRRRFIALKFAVRPVSGAQIASLNRWSPYAYRPEETFLNSRNPRIQGMVKGLVELGAKAESQQSKSLKGFTVMSTKERPPDSCW